MASATWNEIYNALTEPMKVTREELKMLSALGLSYQEEGINTVSEDVLKYYDEKLRNLLRRGIKLANKRNELNKKALEMEAKWAGHGGGEYQRKNRRRNTKKRNTKKRNTKRRNTKRRNTKKRNTKRRNTKRN